MLTAVVFFSNGEELGFFVLRFHDQFGNFLHTRNESGLLVVAVVSDRRVLKLKKSR